MSMSRIWRTPRTCRCGYNIRAASMKVSRTIAAETRGCLTNLKGLWSAIQRSFSSEKDLNASSSSRRMSRQEILSIMGKSSGLKATVPPSSSPLGEGLMVSLIRAVFTAGSLLINITQSSSADATKSSLQKSPASSFTWMYPTPFRFNISRTSGSSAMPAPSIGGSIKALNRTALFFGAEVSE